MPAASRMQQEHAGAAEPPLPEGFPDALGAAALRRSYPAQAVVFKTGCRTHSVFYVESGRVRLVRFGRQGEEVVLHDAGPGEFFAEASLDAARYHCDAVTTAPAILLHVPAPALRDLLARDAAFASQWAGLLGRQLRAARARVERLSLRSARERVLHLLVAEGHGPRSEVILQGTWKDLARDLGLTHEALYRTLAALQREGLVERGERVLRLAR